MAGDPLSNAIANGERPFPPGLGQDDGKLVASEPGRYVGFARACADQRSRFHKCTAADQVSVRVVDTLESVQIDEQQRERAAATRRTLGLPPQHLIQVA